LIGANALIPEGKQIPDGSLVVGSPGRIVRTLSEAEQKGLENSAQHYVENAALFRNSLRADARFQQQ
jgi:carbonic anhydrase/acetyltransferase-like protein (isoleucine patch superfamily)